MVVVGVVMLYIPGAQPFAASVTGAGIGMMVGGIAQMMPKVDEKIKTKTATGQTRDLVVQSLQSHKAIQFRFFMVSVKSVDLL
jgi:predicted phage tail protein